MSLGRQPILNKSEEQTLEPLLAELWNSPLKYTAEAIAQKLKFGMSGTRWEKLKPYHVYYYRHLFNLPVRREDLSIARKGRKRYKVKQNEIMTPNQFIAKIKEIPTMTFLDRRKRAYLVLNYWTPLRKSEIYERKGEDFEIDEKSQTLTIHLFRKKKKATKEEPIEIPLGFPLMDNVISWLNNGEWSRTGDRRPFRFSGVTAWNYVQKTFEGYYPHFFRFNYITDGFDDPETTLAEMKAKTGLSIAVLDRYLMSSMRAQKRMDGRKMEQLKKEGTI